MILFYNDFDIVALSFQCNDQDQIYTCILDRSVVHKGVEVMSIEKIHSQLYRRGYYQYSSGQCFIEEMIGKLSLLPSSLSRRSRCKDK